MRYFGTEIELEFVLTEKKVVFEQHNHVSTYIAGLVLEGQVDVVEEQQTQECVKDDIYLIPIGIVHSIRICMEKTRVLSMCIGEKFFVEYSLEEGKNIVDGYTKRLITIGVLKEDQANTFIEALEAFYCMLQKEAAKDQEEQIQGHETAKVQETIKLQESAQSRDPAYIIKEQIIAQPEQELKLDDMSRQVFISKYYLLRQFKEKVGLTPHHFQIQNRIRKAKQLLKQGLPMAAVATEMGFYDQSHFIRYFQKFTGITPQEYLASVTSLEEN